MLPATCNCAKRITGEGNGRRVGEDKCGVFAGKVGKRISGEGWERIGTAGSLRYRTL